VWTAMGRQLSSGHMGRVCRSLQGYAACQLCAAVSSLDVCLLLLQLVSLVGCCLAQGRKPLPAGYKRLAIHERPTGSW
jgi:hypothetical protein